LKEDEGHIVGMEEMINAYRILLGSLKVRDHLVDLGLDRRIILKWLFRKQEMKA
jgi:hypothetical protein